MPTALLDGVRVVDLAGEPAAMTGRILADLGADVVLVEPPDGHPLRDQPDRFAAWAAGKRSVVVTGPDDAALAELLAGADVVVTTPGFPGTLDVDPSRAPDSVWVLVTPFGASGPRAEWQASDLGVMAASANMFSTGDPDRAPVRCTEPSGYGHTGPEAAFAAITALWSGRPQRVDVSMQETVLSANMGAPGRFAQSGFRGERRGANIGRTREIWPTKDGWVSFGLRGGKARVPSLELITRLVGESGVDASALEAQDWSTWSPNTADDAVLRAVEAPIAEYFAGRTMRDLYEVACRTNLMLAPANSPPEILDSEQLAARGYFTTLDGVTLPGSFVHPRDPDGDVAPVAPACRGAGPPGRRRRVVVVPTGSRDRRVGAVGGRVARGAAPRVRLGRRWADRGPLLRRARRHGAARRVAQPPGLPARLRARPGQPARPRRRADVRRVERREAQRGAEPEGAGGGRARGAPRDRVGRRRRRELRATCHEGLRPGLRHARRGPSRPRHGERLPERPDRAAQGLPGLRRPSAALSGFNWLTGWPDRAPVGPHATITDSLAPRFVATALAAGLAYRRRTGRGVYLDVSQVETGVYALSPWLVAYQRTGIVGTRDGNRSARAVPHGVFPCAPEGDVDDRWVAIVAWDDAAWAALAPRVGLHDRALATLPARQAHIDEVEAAVAAWTATRSRTDVCDELQPLGIEAVPVEDFGDVHDDPQVAARSTSCHSSTR